MSNSEATPVVTGKRRRDEPAASSAPSDDAKPSAPPAKRQKKAARTVKFAVESPSESTAPGIKTEREKRVERRASLDVGLVCISMINIRD
jgi:hypothetical protein